MKIGSVIVTYNPKLDILRKNIQRVKGQVDECILVDNNSNNIDEVKSLAADEGIRVIHLDKNEGIASAQNKGFAYFDSKFFEWVLTLDQDSLIPYDTLEKYKNTKKMDRESTAIISAKYFDRNWTDSQKEALVYQGKENVIEKKLVISSGNLVRVLSWKKVDGFDESLFIDMVDYDFCVKLGIAHYKIWQANNIVMEHAVGDVIHKPILEKILLLPETGLLADHSAFRQYYIYRNTIIFNKRFPNVENKKMMVLRTIFSTRRMLIYKNTMSKIRASMKGIIDGIKYNPSKDKEFLNTIEKIRKF